MGARIFIHVILSQEACSKENVFTLVNEALRPITRDQSKLTTVEAS
jgi:hypothetical protein